MKAIVQDAYGTADLLELREIGRPVPRDDEVLVEVRAAACRPERLASHDGQAPGGPCRPRSPQAQEPGAGLGRRRARGGRRREGDRVQAGRRGVRQLRRLVRRVRARQGPQARAQATQHHLRAGRRPPRLRHDRPPGAEREGPPQAGRPGSRHRCLRRRRNLRRPAGRDVRRRGHRRLRSHQHGSRTFPGRRPRPRLHPRGRHRRLPAATTSSSTARVCARCPTCAASSPRAAPSSWSAARAAAPSSAG